LGFFLSSLGFFFPFFIEDLEIFFIRIFLINYFFFNYIFDFLSNKVFVTDEDFQYIPQPGHFDLFEAVLGTAYLKKPLGGFFYKIVFELPYLFFFEFFLIYPQMFAIGPGLDFFCGFFFWYFKFFDIFFYNFYNFFSISFFYFDFDFLILFDSLFFAFFFKFLCFFFF
jgi:hypothetical protein